MQVDRSYAGQAYAPPQNDAVAATLDPVQPRIAPIDRPNGETGPGPLPNKGNGVSVFIMTRDEEVNIVRCLESVRWSGDVVLLDSGSLDATLDLADLFDNVRVFRRAFTDYADQRNYGLWNIDYHNEWVFVLDADEVVEPDLAREVLAIARRGHRAGSPNAYLVRRRPVLDGVVLGRNISSQFWIARLLRLGTVRYEGRVHEKVRVGGALGKLRGRLEHHQFAKGLENWLERRASYARLQVEMNLAGEEHEPSWRDLFGPDPLRRRALLKACFARMPLQWLLYYVVSHVLTRAFLDGRAGIAYVRLEALSCRLSARMTKEARRC